MGEICVIIYKPFVFRRKGWNLVSRIPSFFFSMMNGYCGLKLMKTKQNSSFSSSPKVPYKEKSTHERIVSA